MYTPEAYKMHDNDSLYALMNNNSFADLITVNNGIINSNKVPLWIDAENKALYGHFGKTNDQLLELETADNLLVIFSGIHSYISPQWYSSDNMVPTWNFETVQVKGKASILDDSGLTTLLEKLTQKHESTFKSPWIMDRLDKDKKQKMLDAIVGFKISIEQIEGKQKFSQNRSDADRIALINELKEQNDEMAIKMANVMQNNLKN